MLQFKDAGYETHLIFIGVNSVEECIQRVALRVKAGGHHVTKTTIIFNFETGLKNLNKFFRKFDIVILLDNSIGSEPIRTPAKLLTWTHQDIYFEQFDFPDWTLSFLDSLKS